MVALRAGDVRFGLSGIGVGGANAGVGVGLRLLKKRTRADTGRWEAQDGSK